MRFWKAIGEGLGDILAVIAVLMLFGAFMLFEGYRIQCGGHRLVLDPPAKAAP